MDCKFDAALLHDYLEGTIDELDRIFVDEHIKVCRKCKKELTMLKLLFWELNEINDDEIDLPAELELIREKTIDNILDGAHEEFGIKKILELQKKNMENSSVYINFIPGKKLLKKGIKNTSSLIFNASGKAIKKSIKIIHSRS